MDYVIIIIVIITTLQINPLLPFQQQKWGLQSSFLGSFEENYRGFLHGYSAAAVTY